VAAVFRAGPEREVYNNAVVDAGLPAAGRAEALAAIESTYAQAGISAFAVWAHEGTASCGSC
jgi:hypothetical protein